MSQAEALAELRLYAGTQFAPAVVEAFLAVPAAAVRPGVDRGARERRTRTLSRAHDHSSRGHVRDAARAAA